MDRCWQISADTGGTFTDCFGISPEGESRLVKVLSSGRLRLTVTEVPDENTLRLRIPDGWSVPDGFFVGYRIQQDEIEIPVKAWKASDSLLTLQSPPAGTEKGSILDLVTGEEAPILGTRLLTGTCLTEDFPPLQFRLGTTRGTNALLERKGAPVAFFVTRGFRDLLHIRDQRRPDLFALYPRRPRPLYDRVIEIDERLDAGGNVLVPIDAQFELEARRAREDGIEVAAVALMHSYQNSDHEEKVAQSLRRLGFKEISLSSSLAPLIKLVPRAETAVVDATLTPVMETFLGSIRRSLGQERSLLTMTSAGGLESASSFRPKDSLLSGPAGGVVGAAAAARDLGIDKVITFDMGGTSTDVARFEGDFLYQFEQKVGDARLLSPALRIETVAAGGGSICQWTEAGLRVGPESAGADPGPACYGRGGPLTITDVNLLLGRIDPDNFGIPIGPENLAAARKALAALAEEAGAKEGLLEGLAAIATEQMADAIHTISVRDGADPTEYTLVAFGGAGPLHACDIAERLGIRRIIVPREAGLLSAYGIHHAAVERFAESQVMLPLAQVKSELATRLSELDTEAIERLRADLDTAETTLSIRRRLAEMRLQGQDATLTIEISSPGDLAKAFRSRFEEIFGYPPDPDRDLEVVTLRVIASTGREAPLTTPPKPDLVPESPSRSETLSFLDRKSLAPGIRLEGPVIVQDPFSSLYLKPDWEARIAGNETIVLTPLSEEAFVRPNQPHSDSEAIQRELFRHRFENLVEEMGAMLQRSAISTNVKERADFSCALLDAKGELVVNAPHIPVHLGALGLCVRQVAEHRKLRPGDTIITNHPRYGGSHLPDVTLVTPVFTKNSKSHKLLGFVANRAHHAEIGGISPGSMPPDARSLEEEGVVLSPEYLVEEGVARFDRLEAVLTRDSPFPTRNLADNLADLHAQLAANRRGESLLQHLATEAGSSVVAEHLETLASQSRDSLASHLDLVGFEFGECTERLDDGSEIHCRVQRNEGKGLSIDFSGTSSSHPGNLHATPAIIRSAILYVLRLWTQSPLPLNEGLLREVDIHLPRCFLNPDFSDDPSHCPAVVGGNVETSQRVVDTLIRLLGFQAGSQGTMNNFLFGNDTFGYYETIGGGTGAGPEGDGESGIHSHMTNTAITDPEILEHRYPVRLREFSLRDDSPGGEGQKQGGRGLIREMEFLEPLRISLLTQHRKEPPFGLRGGRPGTLGRQVLIRNGEPSPLDGITSFDAIPGDILRIETPGGGGWGEPETDHEES